MAKTREGASKEHSAFTTTLDLDDRLGSDGCEGEPKLSIFTAIGIGKVECSTETMSNTFETRQKLLFILLTVIYTTKQCSKLTLKVYGSLY